MRVQVAPPGAGAVREPPYTPLQTTTPTPGSTCAAGASSCTNGNLQVTIDPATGCVLARRVHDGLVLLNQTGLAFAAPPASTPSAANLFSVVATFAGHGADERVYGLGEHRSGKVNAMGSSHDFAASQDYAISRGGDVSMPWFFSSVGYGFIWNQPALGNVSISASAIEWAAAAAVGADFWITTVPAPGRLSQPASGGPPNYAALLAQYADAVGHAAVLPPYATGFIQCKNRYRNQSQLLAVAQGYKDRQLPIAAIVIDYFHWVNQGDWSFNPACWPDPQAMVNNLTANGIELMVTFWPFQTTGSQHWQEYKDKGYLVPATNGTLVAYDGNQYLYSPFMPEAQKATFQHFMEGYGRYGIKMVWLDAAEPEHNTRKLDSSYDWQFAPNHTAAAVAQAWVRQHIETLADGFDAAGTHDYFLLARSAWTGSWRRTAGLWSGDIESSFDELALQVRVAQGVALSGVAFWTTDIGGYKDGNPDDPVFQELIVRWFGFGAFCPLFRLHGRRNGGPPADQCGGTNGDNEVWNLAKDPEHYNAIVQIMQLREKLRPYVQNLSAEVAQTGMPMIRPMFLAFPDDPACAAADVEDQYMFGPAFLVAPVLEYKAASRSVYVPRLPGDASWVSVFDKSAPVPVGRSNFSTPISSFPLFVRSDMLAQLPGDLFDL